MKKTMFYTLAVLGLFLSHLVANAMPEKLPVIILSESNTVALRGEVTAQSIAEVSAKILNLHATLPKGKSIILFLDTPGGSISAGNELIELLDGLPRKVVTVTSFAASMGYQFVQSFSTRYILRTGILMSHRASIGGLAGQVPGEAGSRLKYITELVEQMEKRTAKRVHMSLKEYKESIRDELWIVGSLAVATGHADKMVRARCDDTMQGTERILVRSLFGLAEVFVNKCPLISGPVKVNMSNDILNNPTALKEMNRIIAEYFTKARGIWKE